MYLSSIIFIALISTFLFVERILSLSCFLFFFFFHLDELFAQRHMCENISLTITGTVAVLLYFIHKNGTYGKFNNKCMLFFIEFYRIRHLTLPSEKSSIINITWKTVHGLLHKKLLADIGTRKKSIKSDHSIINLYLILFIMITFVDFLRKV